MATLLDDPEERWPPGIATLRIGGSSVKKATDRGEKEETTGGVLRWGREASPDLVRLREEIREAFGGRSPRVLDPFAGGGAIPLEAMRLGCEVTASDINPVAWFILRCTLHYPCLMAGQDPAAAGLRPAGPRVRRSVSSRLGESSEKATVRAHLARLGHGDGAPEQQTSFDVDPPETSADFPWHLRAWGRRVLAGARRELASRYPTYAEFEPVKRKGARGKTSLRPKRFTAAPAGIPGTGRARAGVRARPQC